MDSKLQDKAWACLPKEAREEIRNDYNSHPTAYHPYFNEGYDEALKIYFGKHNLTSDTEPEEIVPIKRSDIINFYSKYLGGDIREVSRLRLRKDIIDTFGNKCLPNE